MSHNRDESDKKKDSSGHAKYKEKRTVDNNGYSLFFPHDFTGGGEAPQPFAGGSTPEEGQNLERIQKSLSHPECQAKLAVEIAKLAAEEALVDGGLAVDVLLSIVKEYMDDKPQPRGPG